MAFYNIAKQWNNLWTQDFPVIILWHLQIQCFCQGTAVSQYGGLKQGKLTESSNFIAENNSTRLQETKLKTRN